MVEDKLVEPDRPNLVDLGGVNSDPHLPKPVRRFTSWRTPRTLWSPLDQAVGGFAVDAAADSGNSLCHVWYGEGGVEPDALSVERWLSPAWCNPPYGKGLEGWLRKFTEQASLGVSIVSLLPAYVEREWWHRHVVLAKADIVFLVGRVPFERPCPTHSENSEDVCSTCEGLGFVTGSQPRDPSAIVIYGPSTVGQVGWLDWRKRAKALASDGDSHSESRGEGSKGSRREGADGPHQL